MKRTVLASLFAFALTAGAAHAESAPVGGASATITGGGEDMRIAYSTGGAGAGGAMQAQAPRLARARNSYGGVSVEYLEPETAAPGRVAWVVGGGGDAEVVHDRR